MVGRDAASVWKRKTSGLKANIKVEAADVRSGMILRRRCWDEGEGEGEGEGEVEVLLSTRGRYERPFNGGGVEETELGFRVQEVLRERARTRMPTKIKETLLLLVCVRPNYRALRLWS